MKILMVLTSHEQLGETGNDGGLVGGVRCSLLQVQRCRRGDRSCLTQRRPASD